VEKVLQPLWKALQKKSNFKLIIYNQKIFI
jgi:hypothetical protein